MGILAPTIDTDDLVQRALVGPADAAELERMTAALLAELATASPKGNFVAAELSAGGAGGIVTAVLVGSTADIGGTLVWDDVVPRFIVCQDRLTFDTLLERVRAEQALTDEDTLYCVDLAVAGDGHVFVYGMMWGPPGPD